MAGLIVGFSHLPEVSSVVVGHDMFVGVTTNCTNKTLKVGICRYEVKDARA